LLGNNLKVHFAGAEQIDCCMVANKAGVKYFLYSCFPFISAQFGIKAFPITVKNLFPPREIEKISHHCIMDSGLFTLMFGAHAGKRDKPFLERYQQALVDFVLANNINATCVEVDCQKVLGCDEAWYFRKQLRDSLPNRIINVFHWEDGPKGLDRLIEFSDYIAISVPELRILKPTKYKEDTYRLACYIKNKKPSIDIHLLGCTEVNMLNKCAFCTTSDSTTWKSVNRYGRLFGNATSQIYAHMKERCHSGVAEVLDRCAISPSQKRIDYYANYLISAYLHKQEYVNYVGNQD